MEPAQKYLVNSKDLVALELKSMNKDFMGNKLCWMEAYKIIKNGKWNVSDKTQMDEKIFENITENFMKRYEKANDLNNKLEKLFKIVPAHEIHSNMKFVVALSQISDPHENELLHMIHEIYTHKLKQANGNLSKALYLNTYEIMTQIFTEMLEKLGVKPEEKWREYEETGYLPAKKWVEMDTTQRLNAISTIAFRECYKGYSFEESNWNPGHDISELMQELRAHGPLVINGSVGRAFYSKPSEVLKFKVGGKSIRGWDPQAKAALGINNPIGGESHAVVIIGARSSKESAGQVLFVDPVDKTDEKGELPIYVSSLDSVRKKIRNLWNEILFDQNKMPGFFGKFAVYSKV